MKKLLFTSLSIFAIAASAGAQALVSYDFTGATGDQVSQPTASVAGNVTASVLTRGPNLTASGGLNSMSSSGFPTGGIDLNSYYSFTITPDAGFAIDLDTLSFAERRSGTGIRDFSIRTSLDGFSTDIFSVNVPDDTLTRDQAFTFGSAFDSVTSALTIRIYGFNAESGLGTWRLANSTVTSNMELTGSLTPVSVPEPSTWALLGLGCAVVAWNFRRKFRVS